MDALFLYNQMQTLESLVEFVSIHAKSANPRLYG